jgi:hypothetical protein
MNAKISTLILGTICMINAHLHGQSDTNNCFLYNYKPATAVIPASVNAEEPTGQISVIISLTDDTIGKISRHVFGNAIAAWYGSHTDPELVENTSLFAPTLIRFPGGSWSNGYFFNGVPTDVPDSIYDGTTYSSDTQTANKVDFTGHDGTEGWVTSTDQYYTLRQNTGVNEGLITINYGYARYGTSADPVAKAAHLAADWVRYDNGRTKFWEIGNENGGPWEYGWMIDTALNQDGQPQIITGEIYGRHFKVFADSMRKAAAEIGDTVYIGAQIVVYGETSWNFVDRTWNQELFDEVGDAADFYVIHCYFNNSSNVQNILKSPRDLTTFMSFLQQDFIDKGAYPKPVAVTEYNISPGNDVAAVSYVNGMQAVVCMSEFIKNNYGLGARWLLEGLFGAYGTHTNSPHAEFYYLAYLPKFFGDHAISCSSGNSTIFSYASRFSSGETSLIVVNIDNRERVITVSTDSIGVGDKYYVYSFTGGTDSDFSPDVFINGEGPDIYQWGPYDELFNIKANACTVNGDITFSSPGRSVQMILIEGGTNHIHVDDSILVGINPVTAGAFKLYQNYPNPVNSVTNISYRLQESSYVTMKIFDFQGREITSLVNEYQNAGNHSVEFNASSLQSGVYFYGLQAGQFNDIKKLVVIK